MRNIGHIHNAVRCSKPTGICIGASNPTPASLFCTPNQFSSNNPNDIKSISCIIKSMNGCIRWSLGLSTPAPPWNSGIYCSWLVGRFELCNCSWGAPYSCDISASSGSTSGVGAWVVFATVVGTWPSAYQKLEKRLSRTKTAYEGLAQLWKLTWN